jgi:hypothetical protein
MFWSKQWPFRTNIRIYLLNCGALSLMSRYTQKTLHHSAMPAKKPKRHPLRNASTYSGSSQCPILLSHGLGTVALVAARAVVIEVESEVWTLFDGYVVVTVQVSLALVPLLAELFEDDADRGSVEAVCP